MTAFADSSALVKLYVSEIGHLLVRSAGPLVISGLARVEVPAALWRKARSGEVSINDARTLVTEFEFDYVGSSYSSPRFLAILNVGSRLLDEAALLSARHGLRAYDAVQLGSALAARSAAADIDTMAAFDVELRRAAAAEGFALLPTVAPS